MANDMRILCGRRNGLVSVGKPSAGSRTKAMRHMPIRWLRIEPLEDRWLLAIGVAGNHEDASSWIP